MTGPAQRSVADALAAARPLVARLDAGGHPEEVAADLIEAWSATENALRSLIGGSSLSGQLLVSALRQRNLLSIDQAHALLEFLAARDRAGQTDYRPTGADVAAAKEGFRKLDAGLAAPLEVPQLQHTTQFDAITPGTPTPSMSAAFGARGAPPASPVSDASYAPAARQPWGFILAIVVALAAIGALAWYLLAGRTAATGGDALQRGIDAYRAGRYEQANAEFSTAARNDPNSAVPHIWLGRVARDQREDQTAAKELSTAERLEPNNALVHREIGAFLLSRGRYDDARARYARAVQLDPNDKTSQGWLGCALARLGRTDEAQRFFARAGQGEWSSCATQAPAVPGAPGAAPGGAGAPR